MALPKIKPTAYHHHLTGLDRDVQFRCFTNYEQKSLLEAKEEQDPQMIYDNAKNVVQSCILDDDLDVNDLPVCDFEDMFLRIRAKSVDQMVTGSFQIEYKEGNKKKTHEHKFNIDTKDITVRQPDTTVSPHIKLSDNYTLKMKHPTLGSTAKKFEQEEDFIIEHMVCVYSSDGEEVTYIADENIDEVREFYNSLEAPVMVEIAKFLTNQPHLYYKMDVELPNGETKEIEFESLEDFFT